MSGTTPLTDSFTASTPLVSPCDIAGAPRVPPVFRFPAVPIRWRGARRASLHQPAQAVSKSLRVQGLKRTRRLVLQRAAPRCVYVASPPGVGGGAGSAAFTPSGCSVRLARPQTGCAVSPPSTRACCRPADARLAAARSRAGTVPLNTSSARPQYSPWTLVLGGCPDIGERRRSLSPFSHHSPYDKAMQLFIPTGVLSVWLTPHTCSLEVNKGARLPPQAVSEASWRTFTARWAPHGVPQVSS